MLVSLLVRSLPKEISIPMHWKEEVSQHLPLIPSIMLHWHNVLLPAEASGQSYLISEVHHMIITESVVPCSALSAKNAEGIQQNC